MLLTADLHNHTLLSDGAGRAEDAFAMMRGAGIDVAALTDHAVMGKQGGQVTCASGECTAVVGINEDSWQTLSRLADASNDDGRFVAMRGFEWTTPALGHINVWFSETWIDGLSTSSLTDFRGAGELSRESPVLSAELTATLLPILGELPQVASIDGFYEWLAAPPDRAILGGGADALAGFNHPNEYGDFNAFQYVGGVSDRVVSVEALNRFDDYYFRGAEEGMPNPLNACLNAGWKVGMLGVTDEHGDVFDIADGKARAGLWATSLTREGVREALEHRRFYATRRQGLRLDASANGVRMGGTLGHTRGPMTFLLDLDKGPEWHGKRLHVQLLRPGTDVMTVADDVEVRVPGRDAPPITFTRDVDLADGPWLVLRVSDPEAAPHPNATGVLAAAGDAVAYASPFFLASSGGTSSPAVPHAAGAAPAGTLPATGGPSHLAVGAVAAGAAALASHLARRPHSH